MKPTCPICHAPLPPRAENAAYPFCSTRCQNVDLGRWLNGDYRIPGEPLEDMGPLQGEYAGNHAGEYAGDHAGEHARGPGAADQDDPDGDWLS